MHDKAKVAKIKKLYADLDLKTLFEEYEESSYQVKLFIRMSSLHLLHLFSVLYHEYPPIPFAISVISLLCTVP